MMSIWTRSRPSIQPTKIDATMTATEVKEQTKVADILYQFLDGNFNGEKYSFTIHKKGENGQALAGATFAVTADDTGEQVGNHHNR